MKAVGRSLCIFPFLLPLLYWVVYLELHTFLALRLTPAPNPSAPHFAVSLVLNFLAHLWSLICSGQRAGWGMASSPAGKETGRWVMESGA